MQAYRWSESRLGRGAARVCVSVCLHLEPALAARSTRRLVETAAYVTRSFAPDPDTRDTYHLARNSLEANYNRCYIRAWLSVTCAGEKMLINYDQ